jgi:hypothetical protein
VTKFLEYLIGFLALIGLGSLALKKKSGNATEENKKIDDKMKEIAEEVNETDTASLVDDYNKRHGKG